MSSLARTRPHRPIIATVRAIARFESRVVRSDDGCWLWSGPPLETGYGSFCCGGVTHGAHRVAYTIAYGSIPEGMCVCHRCDVRLCVRPDHLFLGTRADNAADRDQKNRTAFGDRNGAHTHPERLARGYRNGSRLHPERLPRGDRHPARLTPLWSAGERNGAAKLTGSQVVEIRRRRRAGEMTTTLGPEFGVTPGMVSHICSGRAWSHIPLENS